MMKRSAILAALFVALKGAPSIAAQSSESLYKSAYSVETVERDPTRALSLYEKILSQTADENPLAARVHLRIGICLEKLGKMEEARGSYQEVLNLSDAPESIKRQAHDHFDRLEKTLTAPRETATVPPPSEREIVALPSASARTRGNLELSFNAGATVSNAQYTPFNFHDGAFSKLFQLSLLYEVTPWVAFGLESSYPFQHGDGSQVQYRSTRKISQLTPEIEIGKWSGGVKPYLTLGGGLYHVKDHIDVSTFYYQPFGLSYTERVVGDVTRNLGGFNAGVGCLFRLTDRFAIGPDIRYHEILDSEDEYRYVSAALRMTLVF